jgi:FKBP-type peptidyl-prolyl cis-trans isomerase FklB
MKSKFLFSIAIAIFFSFSAFTQKTAVLTNELDSLSYSLGLILGTSIEKAGITTINEKLLMQGISEVIGKKEQKITAEQANTIINTYLTKLNEKKAAANLVEGNKFLEENKKKEGVVTLPSGLQYKIIKEGEGASPTDTSMVTVHYTGTFIDGKVFDSSVERGQPATFPVNGVIEGWTEALKLMKPGCKWILYIPPQLAYGEYGAGTIEPNSVLIFDVELLSVDTQNNE